MSWTLKLTTQDRDGKQVRIRRNFATADLAIWWLFANRETVQRKIDDYINDEPKISIEPGGPDIPVE